jgi:periplasmic protein CpxP/Spy
MEKNNTTVWKWMVGLLMALNIVLLVTIWKHPSPPPFRGGEGPAKMIIEDLAFSQKQIQDFEKLKTGHHEGVLKLQREGKILRDNFFDLLSKENPDTFLVNERARAIAGNQYQIETITFHHFEQVRKLCNEEQKKKFDGMIKEILHQMAKRPHREPGEHPRER